MSAQCLRGREAFGVRQLAGAFGPLHCARRPTTPLLPSTNDQMGCSPDYIAHSRAGVHPGPRVTSGGRTRFHPGQGTQWNASLHVRPAPPRSRSAWSAPACWRCRRVTARLETYHPAPAFHKPPDGLLTRLHCPFEGRVPPRPDGNDSVKGPVPPGPGDAVEGVPPVSPLEGPVPPRPVSRSSSEPPDCLRCRDPKRRLRSCAGIKCAPAAKFRKKSLSDVCAGKLSQ